MTHNIDGALITDKVVSQIKYIQESGNMLISILDTEIKLLLSQRKNMQESSDLILNQMEDLDLLKEILSDISDI